MGSCILSKVVVFSLCWFFLFPARMDIFSILKGLELLYQSNFTFGNQCCFFWSLFTGSSCVVTTCNTARNLCYSECNFRCLIYQKNMWLVSGKCLKNFKLGNFQISVLQVWICSAVPRRLGPWVWFWIRWHLTAHLSSTKLYVLNSLSCFCAPMGLKRPWITWLYCQNIFSGE